MGPFRGTLGIHSGTFSGGYGCVAALLLFLLTVGGLVLLLYTVGSHIIEGGPAYQMDE